MIEAIAQFHFLRPFWLLALFPAAGVVWLILRQEQDARRWHRFMAAHLVDHLTLYTEQRKNRLRPAYLLMAVWLVSILALAGPSWQREPNPFAEEQAALAIALKVTSSMLAQDIQPSRLHRAVHKIHDLLALRPGSRTALIVYAGSAHLVMPLTHDARIIETFAAELSPEIMPEGGTGSDVAAQAVALAQQQLAAVAVPGSVLLITDTVASDQLDAIAKLHKDSGAIMNILAIAAGPEIVPPPNSPPAPALDRAALAAAAQAGGGALTLVSPDQRDVEQLQRRISSRIGSAAGEDERWRDAGYYLVALIAVLMLFWFRPGGFIRESG